MKNRSGVSGVQLLLYAAILVGGAYVAYRYMHKPAVTEAAPGGSAKTIITLMGKPGAGKGTLSANARQELGYLTVSTGDLVRAEIAQQTELGKQIKQFSDEGKLVPDDVIFGLVKEWLAENASAAEKIILDGFPRTAAQAALLMDFMKNELPDYKLRVVELQMSDEEVMKRAANRLVCEGCKEIFSALMLENPDEAACAKCGGKLIKREDDKEDKVRARLEEYSQKNKPLEEFYRSSGLMIDAIPADKSSAEVFAEFKTIVSK